MVSSRLCQHGINKRRARRKLRQHGIVRNNPLFNNNNSSTLTGIAHLPPQNNVTGLFATQLFIGSSFFPDNFLILRWNKANEKLSIFRLTTFDFCLTMFDFCLKTFDFCLTTFDFCLTTFDFLSKDIRFFV